MIIWTLRLCAALAVLAAVGWSACGVYVLANLSTMESPANALAVLGIATGCVMAIGVPCLLMLLTRREE
jgi:hypothetical protein